MLECKLFQDIVTFNIFVKLHQNLSINKGPNTMTKFSKNRNYDLGPTMLKCYLV